MQTNKTISWIKKYYNEHYKDVKNKVSVHAIVSKKMNKEEASLMKEKLDRVLNKDTDLSIEVDSSLIGGIKLRIENTFLDASIKSQINNVKLDLMKI
jgi:F-type H+-transporting ATPase subunit delta